MDIQLTEVEMRICRFLGKERQATNVKNGIVDRKKAGRSGEDIHIDGVIGEFATSKYLNVYPDFSTNSRKGSHELIYRGWTLDAKLSKYHNMMTPAEKMLGESDIYIAVSGANPYILVGWCYETELIRKENIVDKGYGPSYWLAEADLHPITELLRIKEKPE